MNNPERPQREIERAINELGATGVQIFTNVNGRPLDDPEFKPVFATMARIDLPIWMHPSRTASFPDYQSEQTVEARDVVGVRLAVRDQRGDVARSSSPVTSTSSRTCGSSRTTWAG